MQARRTPYEALYQKKKQRVNPSQVALQKVSTNVAKYQYRQLEANQHVRLLKLHAGDGDEPLVCEIMHTSLDDCPPYAALSYVWGEAIQGYRLDTLTEGYLEITHNLHMALRSLRHANIEDGTRTLWIDACCIDQNNTKERNQQVRMMDKIYSCATGVVCYIGEETSDSEEGLKLAHILREFVDDDQASPEDIRLKVESLRQFGLPPREHPSWLALRRLMRRPWSTRIWIGQEFALNKNLAMICGDVIFNWNLLPYLVLQVDSNRIPNIILTDPTVDGLNKVDKESKSVATLRIMANLRLDIQGERKRTLLNLLQECHRLESSEPRDKIYALLGLASDRDQLDITPDYFKSTTDVLVDVTARVLQANDGLIMLGSILPEKSIALPSWVPDWTTSPATSYLILSSVADYCACGSTTRKLKIDEQSRAITLRGAIIDRILSISPTGLGGGLSFDKDTTAFEWFHEQICFLHDSTVIEKSSNSASQDALGRTLIANWTYHQKEAQQGLEVGFQAARKIWAISYAESRGYTSQNDANSIWNEEAISADPLLGPGYLDCQSPEEIQLGYDYIRSLAQLGHSRRLCITHKGFLGLVPFNALVEDEIAIFAGGRVPFIVRESSGSYKLIGEAYVHGIMKGEVCRMDGFAWEDIMLL